jgi:hypothetical protein
MRELEDKSNGFIASTVNNSLTLSFNAILERDQHFDRYMQFMMRMTDPTVDDLKYIYDKGLCEVRKRLRFFEVIGDLHVRDEMHKAMRMMDAIGTLYDHFEL